MADILAPRSLYRPSAGSVSSSAQAGSRNRASAARVDRAAADLASLIEAQIIPRLMLAHAAEPPEAARGSGIVGPRTLDAFARMVLASEAPALTAYVETLMQGGLSLEGVYLDLLAPTARRLGDDWNDDLISFTDVTLGLSRLQQVVRAFGRSLPPPEAADHAPAACFAPVPGEQHAFGLVLLEDCFRRAGWRTWLDTGGAADSAAEAVAGDWFDLIGLSASSDVSNEAVRVTVTQVRAASMNPDLFVMVGGRLFIEDPTLTHRVGADASAVSAPEALSLANEAVKPRAFA